MVSKPLDNYWCTIILCDHTSFGSLLLTSEPLFDARLAPGTRVLDALEALCARCWTERNVCSLESVPVILFPHADFLYVPTTVCTTRIRSAHDNVSENDVHENPSKMKLRFSLLAV